MIKRLANVKTRTNTGFDHVMNEMGPQTPFGIKRLKEQKPFFPGEEASLRRELDRIGSLFDIACEDEKYISKISDIFMDMKDVEFTVERSKSSILTVVEIFEMKCLLLKMEQLSSLFEKQGKKIPDEFVLSDIRVLLDELDPRGDRLNTFYIYEEFSKKLADLRNEKRMLETGVRKSQKERREKLHREKGIMLTPKFDCVVSKSDEEAIKTFEAAPELERSCQDIMSVTFQLVRTEKEIETIEKTEMLAFQIEEEEEKIREKLSKRVWAFQKEIRENCMRIGSFDLTLAKALYAIRHTCVKPEIIKDYAVYIKDGRQLQAEEILDSKDKEYMPVSISLDTGVTCITGANMGGKTVSLKMIGLTVLLAQYGYFVPCKSAKIGLSNFIQMLMGDSQSLERGLSSFGSEMEELKEIFDHCTERSLIMVDEIASGTNPAEGLALTKSVIDFLKEGPYISVITTHFDVGEGGGKVKNMQVTGLANADFTKLDRELRYANRKERIGIIGKYMDYRLSPAKEGKTIPKDAINIAKMLGIENEIIENAKKYLKGEKG